MRAGTLLAGSVEECGVLLVMGLCRRGGIEIQTAVANDRQSEAACTIHSSHKASIICDTHIDDYQTAGGKTLATPGRVSSVDNLKANQRFSEILKAQGVGAGHLVAVCTGPTVLGNLGLLDGERAMVYLRFGGGLGATKYEDTPIVVDGQVITERGLGVGIDFVLEIVRVLHDRVTADKVAAQIVHPVAG